jgi:GNAT superfamily N-acetyltransferase
MAVEVRILVKGDAGLLAEPADDLFDNPVTLRGAEAFLAAPGHHMVAGVADGRIIGFVSAVDYIHPDKERQLWINEVAVAPPFRRLGIALRMIAAMLEHGRKIGCTEAWVAADADAPGATELYARSGGSRAAFDAPIFEYNLRAR